MPKIIKKTEAKKTAPKKSSGEPERVERPRDDARAVASASDGALTTDQIRVLRRVNKGPCLMRDLKTAIGLRSDQKYSGKFLHGVHQLIQSKMISCAHFDESRAFEYGILAKGRKALAEAIADAKAVAAVKAKG